MNMTIAGKLSRICGLLASLASATGGFAQAAPPGRLQEGPFTHHFDGNRNESVRRPRAASPFPAIRLTGRCVATANMFSGRPDPSWTLSVAQSRRAWHRLQNSRPAEAANASRFADTLGYRGLVLRCGTAPRTAAILIRCGDILAADQDFGIFRAAGLDRDILAQKAGRSNAAFLQAYERSCGVSRADRP
jgi:hypothetical protein